MMTSDFKVVFHDILIYDRRESNKKPVLATFTSQLCNFVSLARETPTHDAKNLPHCRHHNPLAESDDKQHII